MVRVDVRFLLVGDPPRMAPFITIDGRQALKEGPRSVGYCVYCKTQCAGATTNCEQRVWAESASSVRPRKP